MKNTKHIKGGVVKMMSRKEYREWQEGWQKWQDEKIISLNNMPKKQRKNENVFGLEKPVKH